MSDEPEYDPNEQVEALVRRYRQIGADIAGLKAEQDEIKAMVNDLVQVGWKGKIDGIDVHKREPNRVYCPITAVSLLTAAEKKQCVVTRYDDKLVRAIIKGNGKEDECMLPNEKSDPVLKIS